MQAQFGLFLMYRSIFAGFKSRLLRVLISSAALLCLLISAVYAETPNLKLSPMKSCTAVIDTIQTAKGTGTSGEARPLNSQWQTIPSVPDDWTERWGNYSGTAWYKLTWRYSCPAQQTEPIMLMISYISMAGQVFVNDQLLWQSKSLQEPLSRNWNNPRRWVLPAGVLRPGENTILIRVTGAAELHPGVGQVHVGSYENIKGIYDNLWLQMRGLQTYTLCFEIALAVIAGLVWVFRREEAAFGWYSLDSFLWITFSSFTLLLEPLMGLSTLQMERLSTFIFFNFACFSCIYTWRFANTRLPKIERLFAWLILTVGILLLSVPDHALKTVLGLVFFAGLLIYVGNCLQYPWMAYRSKQTEAYLLAVVVFCIYAPLSIHDTYALLTRDGTFWSAYTSPAAMTLIACIFAIRLTRSLRSVERFNQTLAQTVEQVRQELSESMHNAHQLELKNAKLQERIQLAHDLHDGLGGSLVRSMASVEHSPKDLSNPQFLSMLKNLRDDLRQIIDSGSSLDSKVPETPALWIAPLRYRFNQLFDELGIHAEWKMPHQWDAPVTVMDCLAMQRVIEECLTNVIKHSEATQVSVQLQFNDPQQVYLCIQDNGKGFDAEAVKASGLSVGLRSMKFRLEKIQARMQVQSGAGCTRIEVEKSYTAE